MAYRKQGFSLIELLIVMTVIVVLTAIAVPMHSNYRIRSFNSAASSDLRNARSACESFYSEYQVYASSAAAGLPGIGAVFTAAMNSTGAIAAGSLAAPKDPFNEISSPGFTVGLSQNVGLVINTSPNGESYTMAAKNIAGDRCFGMDSDATAVYWINGAPGSGLTAASLPPATAKTNNFMPGAGAAGGGACNGSPAGSGQTTWTAR